MARGAVAVVCLAFPLVPPRRSGSVPAPSRLAELDDVAVPALVVSPAGPAPATAGDGGLGAPPSQVEVPGVVA